MDSEEKKSTDEVKSAEAITTTVPTPTPAATDSFHEAVTKPGIKALSDESWHELQEKELAVRCFGLTDVGLVREHNEDAYLIADLSKRKLFPDFEQGQIFEVGKNGAMFAVCDGMGGAAAGEVASKMAIDILYQEMVAHDAVACRDDFAEYLVEALHEAGDRILKAASNDRSRQGMGTTATVAGLADDVLFIGQVGDSRAYLLRNGRLTQLTRDQTLLNQLLEVGQLTPAEAEAFEHSNIILQALGTTERVQVDLSFIELRRGDRLLLCSDGLSGLVTHEALEDVLTTSSEPDACCRALIEIAKSGGGDDNITAVIVDFLGRKLKLSSADETVAYAKYTLEGVTTAPPAPASREFLAATLPPFGERRRDIMVTPAEGIRRPRSHSPLWFILGFIGLVGVTGLVVAAYFHMQADKERTAKNREEASKASKEAMLTSVPIQTHVDGGVLYVDDEFMGELPYGEQQKVSLEPGKHKFEVRVGTEVLSRKEVDVASDVPVLLDPPPAVVAKSAEPEEGATDPDERPVTSVEKPAPKKRSAKVPATDKPVSNKDESTIQPAATKKEDSTKASVTTTKAGPKKEDVVVPAPKPSTKKDDGTPPVVSKPGAKKEDITPVAGKASAKKEDGTNTTAVQKPSAKKEEAPSSALSKPSLQKEDATNPSTSKPPAKKEDGVSTATKSAIKKTSTTAKVPVGAASTVDKKRATTTTERKPAATQPQSSE